MPIPERFKPRPLDPDTVRELVEIAGRIERRDGSAIAEFFARTGRLLGWMDVHSAAGAEGVEELVKYTLLRDAARAPALEDLNGSRSSRRSSRPPSARPSTSTQSSFSVRIWISRA